MRKKGKTQNKERRKLLPQFHIKKKLARLNKRVVEYFLSFDFIHWFIYKRSNYKEFKKISINNAKNSTNTLIEGLGGVKNLIKVKKTLNSLEVFFKSRYLIRKETIQNCGGLGVTIFDNKVFLAFGKEETKQIVKNLRMKMQEAKRKYKEADIE